MPKLIKNGLVIDDAAAILVLDETQAPEALDLPAGPVFVPFAVWQAHKGQLAGQADQREAPGGALLLPRKSASEQR